MKRKIFGMLFALVLVLGLGLVTAVPATPALAVTNPTTLQIFKFQDLNGDGVYEPGQGETPLSGWQFNITGPGYSSSGITNWSGIGPA